MKQPRREEGSSYIIVLGLTLFLGLFVGAVYTFTTTVARATNERVEIDEAKLVAESGFNHAVSEIWDDYLEIKGGTAGPPSDFRNYLEATHSLTDGGSVTLDAANFPTIGIGSVASIEVTRFDNGSKTDLTIVSRGTAGGRTVAVTGVYSADGKEFEGFEFALLANNVNCIFCHAEIDSVASLTPGTPYKKVKVASLESLLLREGSADSRIAGSLYTRGDIVRKDGTVIDMNSIKAGTLGSYEFDQNGQIVLDQSGNKKPLDFQVAQPDGNGNFGAGENLYTAYPEDESKMSDGVLPTEFPSVFPDFDGDRVIDQDEYDEVRLTATGNLGGGVIYSVPHGSSYNSTSLPGGGNTQSVSEEHGGNLILKGTNANPLLIDGRILVDGDVVIMGTVKGQGSVYARGNVYVVGDLTYKDGTDNHGNRTFGVAQDGTVNKLGLAAGGNIMVGDYLTPRGGDITNRNSVIAGAP